jgi:hypothetical protein
VIGGDLFAQIILFHVLVLGVVRDLTHFGSPAIWTPNDAICGLCCVVSKQKKEVRNLERQ